MDEVEIKYRLAGPAEHERLRAALRALGATSAPVQQEANQLYDTEARDLASRGAVLRVRRLDGGPAGRLTFKGAARFNGPVKTREEIEVTVGDTATMDALFKALGYRETAFYAKERESWQVGVVEVVLDTLSFGHFCELEGPEDAITALAVRLDLDLAQVEPRGYPTLAALANNESRKRNDE